MPLKLDYYYGEEAEQFSFYRVPKLLFTDRRFCGVSVEAKVLYGIMLDRMALSARNGWLDERGRVYIIFKVSDVMETLGCAAQKANKLLGELDTAKGIGLIERVRRGLGRPNVIYVKNFIGGSEPDGEGGADGQEAGIADCEAHGFENEKIKNPEMRKSKIRNCENQKSRDMKITSLEMRKSQTSNTENHHTDRRETDPSIYLLSENGKETDYGDRAGRMRCPAADASGSGRVRFHTSSTGAVRSPAIPPVPDQEQGAGRPGNGERMTFDGIDPGMVLALRYAEPVQAKMPSGDPLEAYRKLVRENISYGILLSEKPCDKERLDGVVELIAETCFSSQTTIRVNQTDMPAETVRARLLKLEIGHIRYVLECMDKSTAQIGNIKSYLLSALYNAPVTISQYYASRVRSDMAAASRGG